MDLRRMVLAGIFGVAAAWGASAAVVEYVDPTDGGAVKSCEAYEGAGMPQWQNGKWYVAEGSARVPERIQVGGNVNLILKDGAVLTATNGIRVPKGASLTIWGQQGGSGRLEATGAGSCAGIGGNKEESGGTVTINGGVVVAQGGQYGAGIGGGDTGNGGTVTVNGGEVAAYTLYCVAARTAAKEFSGAELTLAMLATGAAVFAPLAVADAAWHGGGEEVGALLRLPLENRRFLSAVLFQGLGASVLGFFLSNLAIAKAGVNRTASFIGVATAASIVAGVCFLGEDFGAVQAGAAALIIVGVWIANQGKGVEEG